MKTLMIISLLFLFGFNSKSCAAIPVFEKPIGLNITTPKDSTEQHNVQVVFALDATGSMSGLIGTAKEKIWSITSSFTQTEGTTHVEVGLIFYRDKGDAFITRQVQLTNDLDSVYEILMDIKADGGGDSPESVNQGLYEAVTKMNWSKDTSTFKTVFLVGDCPPHMNYTDDVKYTTSCAIAREKDIVLNTILMGTNASTRVIWREIAACSNGEFMQVGMGANNVVVETPFDDSIAKLSDEMDKTRNYYGTEEYKAKTVTKQVQSTKVKSTASKSSAARRAEYNITTSSGKKSYYGKNELVNDYKEGKVDVTKIKADHLPKEMVNMTPEQKKAYLDKQVAKRDSIDKNMKVLVEKRKEYIDKELSKKSKEEVETSFENQVYENVKKQAAKKNVKMTGKAKL